MNIRVLVAAGGMMTVSAIAADKVKLEDLPAPVQKTVQNETKNATLVGVSKETEKGKTLYEVETKVGSKTRDLMVTPEGKVTAVEEEISINAVPAIARQVIERRATGGQIKKVEMVMAPGKLEPYYEATIETKGKSSEVAVNANGSHHR
jgi:uncharacterized membrane protein YkoI